MVFNLPTFNLTFSVWRPAPAIPANLITNSLPGQLYANSRALLDRTPLNPGAWVPPVIIRVPRYTSYPYFPLPGDLLMCNQNPNVFYHHIWSHTMHKGFVNQYQAIYCDMCDSTGAVARYYDDDTT